MRAGSESDKLASIAHEGSNVIIMPLANAGRLQQRNTLLFTDAEQPEMPPGLIDEQPLPETRRKSAKKPRKAATKTKTGAKKKVKPAAKKAKVPGLGKTKKASAGKSKPKAVVIEPPSVEAPKAEVPVEGPHVAGGPVARPPETVQPLARSQAPVVWRKEGPFGAVGFWLRTASRNVMAKLRFGQPQRRESQPLGSETPRTRNELLQEIAVLRRENAAMRELLGFPPRPFGRQVADRL